MTRLICSLVDEHERRNESTLCQRTGLTNSIIHKLLAVLYSETVAPGKIEETRGLTAVIIL